MPRRLRIGFVVTDLHRHGAEAMLHKLVSRMDKSRFEPTVIGLTGGDLLEQMRDSKIMVHCLEMGSVLSAPLALVQLAKLSTLKEFDIIQGWMYHGNVAAQLTSRLVAHNPPVLIGIRQSLSSLSNEKRLTRWVIRADAKLSRAARKVVYVSQVAKQQHEEFGYAKGDSVVIPNGFDLHEYAPSEQARSAVRSMLGLRHDAFLVGMVARFHRMKRHDVFLRAAARLVLDDARINFILVGTDAVPENPHLRNLILELGLSGRVHCLGARQDIPLITAALDIAALSSGWGEGFPNVIGEAMSCQVPCVATDVGDTKWIIGETGSVVPPGDDASLADALLNLVRDEPLRRRLGTKARSRIREFFSIEAVVAQYESLYEGLSGITN